MRKVTDMTEIIGLSNGHRAVVFTIVKEDGGKASVTLDLYGAASRLDGKTYAHFESTMLASCAKAGITPASWDAYVVA